MAVWIQPVYDRTDENVAFAQEQIQKWIDAKLSGNPVETYELKGCFNLSTVLKEIFSISATGSMSCIILPEHPVRCGNEAVCLRHEMSSVFSPMSDSSLLLITNRQMFPMSPKIWLPSRTSTPLKKTYLQSSSFSTQWLKDSKKAECSNPGR